MDALLVKNKEWSYEREWRCFTELPEQLSAPERFLVGKQVVSVPFPYQALSAIIFGHRGGVDASKFLQNPLVSHVKQLVCRIDPMEYAFNLRSVYDTTYIEEAREAAMWGRRQR